MAAMDVVDEVNKVGSLVRTRETDMNRWERVADAIRQQIRDGHINPGDYLPSYRLLGQQHGVSYGTIRQALTVLRLEGWIEGEPGVGVRVRGDHPA